MWVGGGRVRVQKCQRTEKVEFRKSQSRKPTVRNDDLEV